ncbi:MAG: hypothetical protein Q8Q60_01865 [Candidatus Chromulinivorax sp.]|nr:hypothetical protein [Candidatus Chromulinivorax sp.]
MKKNVLFIIFTMIFTTQGMFASGERRSTGFKSLAIDTSISPQSIIAISPGATTSISPKSILKAAGSPSPVNTHGSISPKRVFFNRGSLTSPSHFTQIIKNGLENDDLVEVKRYVDEMCEGRRVTTQMKQEAMKEFPLVAFNVMCKGAGNEDATMATMTHIESALGIAKTASTDFASDSREW